MKKLFILGFIIFSFSITKVTAESKVPIPVEGMSATEFESMFKLETGITPLKVILDCQSFLHGINVYQMDADGSFKTALEFFLHQPECVEIYEFVKKQTDNNKTSCIVLDTDAKSYELFESCDEARGSI